MSIFSDASGFIITNSTFHIQNTNSQYGWPGIDVLYKASSPGAILDSSEHYDHRCFPGTREQYITDITNWVTESVDAPSSVYWMKGPAGVGKSAIAQTCAEKLKKTGHLGAAFFFTFNKHNDPLRLFTTIAYQLTTILPDYRDVVNDRITVDKSLVEKKLSTQFESLIVEPLQELEKQGKEVKAKVIFIDGLDECVDEDAQADIIEVIASSVRTRSTPFRWAIFSRAEPRIVSTFKQDSICCVTHSVELSISREADREIEMYLRGEFKHLLQQRDCPELLSKWPTDDDIRKLVDAAAGLFAHSAAVLRFVAYPLDWQFRDRLQSVLDALLKLGKQSSASPLPQLDSLYFHIMNQIPENILPSVQLFLCYAVLASCDWNGSDHFFVTSFCCGVGCSESTFRDICHHLHGVVVHQAFPTPLSSIDPRIDLTRSFDDQGDWFHPDISFCDSLYGVHGLLGFYHKSFHDFLNDPVRSGTFCVTTPAIYWKKFFHHLIQQHRHSASSYVIEDLKLVLALDVVSVSVSLSWPHGTKFVDSFLKLIFFAQLSFRLSHDDPDFCRFIGDIPSHTLEQLAELDHRKSLIASMMTWELPTWVSNSTTVFGISGIGQALSHTLFSCIRTDKIDALVPEAFLSMIYKLEEAKVIRPFHPRFGSSRATALLRIFSRKKSGKNSGLYKLGHREKSVIWYWEFDMEERYFHQFRTIDYVAAMEFYTANKFTMWEEENRDKEEGEGEEERVGERGME